MKYKVILADNCDDGQLSFFLESAKDLKLVGLAANDKDLLKLIKNQKPHLIIIDINFPLLDGLCLVRKVLEKHSNIKIIVYTHFIQLDIFEQLMSKGISGYLNKSSKHDELKKAIAKVNSGGKYFSDTIMQAIANRITKNENALLIKDKITNRELEVLRQLCLGYTRIEIADKLNISEKTVDKHRQNLIKKTNSKNSIELAMFAIDNGIHN